MGLWSSFLDFFWPVTAKRAEPEPTFDARAADWRRALRQSVDEMMAERHAKADKAAVQALPTGMGSISGATFTPSKPTVHNVEVGPDWKPWPPLQFDSNAEGKLRRITGSRGLEEPAKAKRLGAPPTPVRTPLGSFESMTAAAKAHGINVGVVSRLVARGEPGWRRAVEWRRGRPPRPVIDPAGVRHPSLTAAGRAHGCSPTYISHMLAGRCHNSGWRYAD